MRVTRQGWVNFSAPQMSESCCSCSFWAFSCSHVAVLVYVSLPRLLLDLSARIIWLLLFCSVAFTLVWFLFFFGVFFWMTGWTGLRFGCVSATEVHSLSHKHAERAVGISKRTLTRTRALAGRGKLQREDVQHNSRAGILILGREVLDLIDCLVFTLLWEQFKMH